MASKNANPGILYVTMQPKDTLPPAQFHDWYNNDHGPTRLRLPWCQNGFRYRASDLENGNGAQEKPEWMAIYDIEDMDYLTQESYTRLRKAPVQSQRERDTMKQIHVDRRFYDALGEEWAAADFKKLEEVESEGEGNVMIAVFLTLREGADEKELAKWYSEEHVPLLQKVPGWRRTRRFVTSYLDVAEGKSKEYLALHEYAPENGLRGEEFKKATTTEWNDRIYRDVVDNKRRRVYTLYYTFGPAPRDLESLSSPNTFPVDGTDGKTKSIPASASGSNGGYSVLESFITTPDRVELPYRLEGSSDPNAPLLICVNSILVTYGIWDAFIPFFLATTKGKYRVLRYNTRGRSTLPSSAKHPVTVDMLADDVITLMNSLRAKTVSVVGVSLGGATALNVALNYPERITTFVACDTNSLAPPGNPKAWGERIDMAKKQGATFSSSSESPGEPIVGTDLAEATVRRWFVPDSYTDPSLSAKIAAVKDMVATNSLAGFKDSVKALYEYDFRDKMKAFKGKGAFLVGAGDGVLPKTMREMAEGLGRGVDLRVVEGAGHLPMVERPEEVARFVAEVLGG
ncbi:alpha/beta hydrolase-like protein [Lentithecium fluviatile CBS 122367]|uniref:Alpha/beta hydrolase-like protein n=1 Tax=Lentithecium fluviatile CBS 122367 TaxID=1168545 RepID=A0A6G1JD48_9PLEO|nr:alpha/beta hydrolase-like protein [Lentithecium fluviatile CBS 122367]